MEAPTTLPYSIQQFRNVYPHEKQCPLKDHKKVFIQKEATLLSDQFCLTQFKREAGVKNEGEHLSLISKDNKIICLYAEKEILDLIEYDLKNQIHNFFDEIESSIYLPKDFSDFEGFKQEVIGHCLNLKSKQIQISKICHKLIYMLYGFTEEISIQMMDAGY